MRDSSPFITCSSTSTTTCSTNHLPCSILQSCQICTQIRPQQPNFTHTDTPTSFPSFTNDLTLSSSTNTLIDYHCSTDAIRTFLIVGLPLLSAALLLVVAFFLRRFYRRRLLSTARSDLAAAHARVNRRSIPVCVQCDYCGSIQLVPPRSSIYQCGACWKEMRVTEINKLELPNMAKEKEKEKVKEKDGEKQTQAIEEEENGNDDGVMMSPLDGNVTQTPQLNILSSSSHHSSLSSINPSPSTTTAPIIPASTSSLEDREMIRVTVNGDVSACAVNNEMESRPPSSSSSPSRSKRSRSRRANDGEEEKDMRSGSGQLNCELYPTHASSSRSNSMSV